MTENPLETAFRHVSENSLRIERQKALIARFEEDEREDNQREAILIGARQLLTELEVFQQSAEDRLQWEQARSETAAVR